MGYVLNEDRINILFEKLKENYLIYAPKTYHHGGRFSDTDSVRYGEITSIDEVEFEKKSDYSFKEILLPISETLFYFTDTETTVPKARKKGAIIFMRSCDIHALERLDEMYLKSSNADFYYNRLRNNTKIVLMSCSKSYDNCFCVSMKSNKTDCYDMSVDKIDGNYEIDCKCDEFRLFLEEISIQTKAVTPRFVENNDITIAVPENLTDDVRNSDIWREYDSRCIACGKCNFVCPTCTCFTMQDLFYDNNGKVGERRRVAASCMVDGYTDVAGGGSYRKRNGERMRFKVLHKVLDYKKRTGQFMCIGCGRCDDICPEYISFTNILTKLKDMTMEATNEQ